MKAEFAHLPTRAFFCATSDVDPRAQVLRIEPNDDRNGRGAFTLRRLLHDARATPQARRAGGDQRGRVHVGGVGRGQFDEDDRHALGHDTARHEQRKTRAPSTRSDAVCECEHAPQALPAARLGFRHL